MDRFLCAIITAMLAQSWYIYSEILDKVHHAILQFWCPEADHVGWNEQRSWLVLPDTKLQEEHCEKDASQIFHTRLHSADELLKHQAGNYRLAALV